MARLLLACALLVSMASIAGAESRLTVDITNRGCILDITARDLDGPVRLDANLALWISPVDVVGPIQKLDVSSEHPPGLVRSVSLCGHALLGTGSLGVTAVLSPVLDVNYHGYEALRGTALITFPAAEVKARPPRVVTCVREERPSPSSRSWWPVGASGALLALGALFVMRRRGAATYIV